jgi:hypothetical protein
MFNGMNSRVFIPPLTPIKIDSSCLVNFSQIYANFIVKISLEQQADHEKCRLFRRLFER